MTKLRFREYLFLVVCGLFALWIGGIIKPAPEGLLVHQDAPLVWSMVTGPYAHIAEESDARFEEIYVDGNYEGAGHAQYGSLILICMRGQPVAPVDGSTREIWCVAWNWDGTDWVLRELYMWGTQEQYDTAKEAGFR